MYKLHVLLHITYTLSNVFHISSYMLAYYALIALMNVVYSLSVSLYVYMYICISKHSDQMQQ